MTMAYMAYTNVSFKLSFCKLWQVPVFPSFMLYFCKAWHVNYLAGDSDVSTYWAGSGFRTPASHAGAAAYDAIQGKFRYNVLRIETGKLYLCQITGYRFPLPHKLLTTRKHVGNGTFICLAWYHTGSYRWSFPWCYSRYISWRFFCSFYRAPT